MVQFQMLVCGEVLKGKKKGDSRDEMGKWHVASGLRGMDSTAATCILSGKFWVIPIFFIIIVMSCRVIADAPRRMRNYLQNWRNSHTSFFEKRLVTFCLLKMI